MCNIRIETVEIEVGFGKSTPIFTDEDGNMFAEVLVDNDIEFEGTSTNFYIDNDIITEYEDELYRIQAGLFEIENSMGTMGGYKIPILKL